MTTPTSQYEYRGAKAAYWDLLRGDTSKWEDTQPQVMELYTAAGFTDVRLVRGFTDVPTTEADTIFSAFGRRP